MDRYPLNGQRGFGLFVVPESRDRRLQENSGGHMKAREEFMLREIAGEAILVPTGDAALEINGLISLNGSGVMLYRMLQQGTTEDAMTAALLEEYEVTEETAKADVRKFIDKMQKSNILLDNGE